MSAMAEPCPNCDREMVARESFSFSPSDLYHDDPQIANAYKAATAMGADIDGEWAMHYCAFCDSAVFKRAEQEQENAAGRGTGSASDDESSELKSPDPGRENTS